MKYAAFVLFLHGSRDWAVIETDLAYAIAICASSVWMDIIKQPNISNARKLQCLCSDKV